MAEEERISLFGDIPEAKKRKFILVDDPGKGGRVRVRVTLDTVDTDEIRWSECGEGVGLNINSELRLSTSEKQANGWMSTDLEQIHELQWRRC